MLKRKIPAEKYDVFPTSFRKWLAKYQIFDEPLYIEFPPEKEKMTHTTVTYYNWENGGERTYFCP